MSKRQTLLAQLAAIDAENTVDDLRRQLDEVRESISNHELEQAKRRALELSREIETEEARRFKRQTAIERELIAEIPQVLSDLQSVIGQAYSRHQMSETPLFTPKPGADNSAFSSWVARGDALCKLAVGMRDLWRHADCLDRLAALVAEHRDVLPELRHVVVAEDVANV